MILFPEGTPTHHETFDEYCAGGGYQPPTKNILEEVIASGLCGRGGAGFPVGSKWTIAAQTAADTRYVVCNAGEDEPGSFKDRVLLEYRPHLVLEGILLATRAISAMRIYFYINETYDACFERLATAIDDASAAGFLNGITVTVHRAPTVYVAGEDSAALEVLEGKAPKPRQKPPYPAVAGLYGKPTVVNNVETLANIPPIVRNGASWFRSYGTPQSPGTMIFCLDDEMNSPGAYELTYRTPLMHFHERIGHGLMHGKIQSANRTEGDSAAFLPADQVDIALDPESLKRAGSSLGCGVMRFY